MKKLFLLISLFCLILFLTPILVNAQEIVGRVPRAPQGLVPCGNPGQPACTINDFFIMLARIFNFIVWWVATPLAILMMTIGGIMIMISAGNPNLASKGKEALQWSAIGLALVFCSWLIVNFILTTLGFKGAWNVL